MEDNKDQSGNNAEGRSRKMPPMRVEIVKRLVEVDRAEDQGILSYNWERDILDTSAPSPTVKNTCVADEKMAYLDPWGIGPDKWHSAVRADPNDYIQLEMEDGECRTIHAHKWMWYKTIDQYLYTYFLLQEKKAAGQWVELNQPDEANELLKKYINRAQARQKTLPPIVMLDKRKNRKGQKAGNGYYPVVVQEHIKNAMGNLLWHWLAVRKNDIYRQESLMFDGLPLWLSENTDLVYEGECESGTRENGVGGEKGKLKVNVVDNFTLTDYIYHEMITGISLSIEITAVLLEFEDPFLRQKALHEFQKNALKDVVASPMLFSRICSARHFFQQILMEIAVDQYEWTLHAKDAQEEERLWEQRVNRARAHISPPLKPVPVDLYDVDIEKARKHLTVLFRQMKQPVDLLEYVEQPKYGLAIFCNQKHKNVEFFLDELRMGQARKLQEDPETTECRYTLFREVHAMVREAIWYLQA